MFCEVNNNKDCELVEIQSKRTDQQNKGLWKFFTILADKLNDMGLDMRKVLKPEYFIPWTKDSIHDNLWIPIQKAMYSTNSTRELKKQEQINTIHKVVMRELAKEPLFVEFIPFPSYKTDKDEAPLIGDKKLT